MSLITLIRNKICLFLGFFALSAVVNQALAQVPTAQSSTVKIKIYPVKYATPRDLVEILTKLIPDVQVILGPQPKYVRDALTGETLGVSSGITKTDVMPEISNVPDQFVRFILIKGEPAKIDQALELLAQIDLPAPQVIIEVQILDISEGSNNALGITYDLAPGGKTAAFKLDRPKSQGKGQEIIFGRLNRDPISFNAALEAAFQKNKAKLLASPKLLVLYNQRARIFIGDEVTFLLGTRINQNGTTLETGKVSVGVELNVTAIGNPDGTINLKINPEVGNFLQLETQSNGITLPRISRRTVQTAVRLNDGETLVIGGLMNETDVQSIRKVPLLGDLPILGQLFRRESHEKEHSELVILLKASIQKDQKEK
jgi:type II secretory pathway component GspD/PulD (secretin)